MLTKFGGLHPSLYLDFLGGSLDSRITASGGANGTRVNSSGTIVAANAPRFDYNPVSLASLGLLGEEARTNLYIWSSDLTNAIWTKTTGVATGASKVAPDGTNTGVLFVPNNAASGSRISQGITWSAATTYTKSVWVAPAGRTSWILLIPGSVFTDTVNRQATFTLTGSGSVSGLIGTGATAAIQQFSNGWYRCQLTFLADNAVTAGPQMRDPTTGDGVNGVYLWGGQTEVGSFATSYDPTTTVTVTRTIDSNSATGSNFTSWYNATQGTFVVQGAITGGTVPCLFSVDDGTTNNLIRLSYESTKLRLLIISGGVTVADLSSVAVYTPGTVAKVAIAFAVNDFAVSFNGAAVLTSVSGAVPVSPTRLVIGNGTGGGPNNDRVAALKFYPSRQSNTSLQSLST